MQATIRPLTVHDLDAFLRIRRESLLTDPQAFEATPETDEALDAAYVRSRLEESSVERAHLILGAFSPGLAGIVGLAPHRAIPGVLWLWGFYVAPDHRGVGIGRALLREAIRVGAAAPLFTSITLRVSSQAKAAFALYERAGFVPSREVPSPLGKDAVPMTLDLSRIRADQATDASSCK